MSATPQTTRFRPRWRVPLCTALVMTLVLMPSSASAQEVPIRWFAVEDIGGSIDFRYQMENRRERRDAVKTEQDQWFAQEALTENLRTYIYRSRLLDLFTLFTVGRQQGELSIGDRAQDLDGERYGYIANIQLLKEHPYSALLFTCRSQTLVSRSFAGSVDVDASSSGITLRSVNDVFPFNLTYCDGRIVQNEKAHLTVPPGETGRQRTLKSLKRLTGSARSNYPATWIILPTRAAASTCGTLGMTASLTTWKPCFIPRLRK